MIFFHILKKISLKSMHNKRKIYLHYKKLRGILYTNVRWYMNAVSRYMYVKKRNVTMAKSI